MSRYLTPSKIGIFEILHLYHEGNVPLSGSIPVLSFVASQLPRGPFHSGTIDADAPSRFPATLREFQTVLSPLQSKIPGRTVYDLFLAQLWTLNDFDAFQNALTVQAAELLERRGSEGVENENEEQKINFSFTSPIGRFIRKCKVEFERLQFHDAYELWEAFLAFRAPSKASLKQRVAESADSFGADLTQQYDMHVDAATAVLRDQFDKRLNLHTGVPLSSQEDAEQLVRFQLQKLQQFGNRVPEEMKDQLHEVIQQGATMPSDVHFINFFDAWRSGAYTTAIEHLHRYFDYTMEAQIMHNGIKTHHQYALLHLAVLHADFGCYTEAISAMSECIATARENQDARCLHFSLSWLSHLRKAFPALAELENTGQGTELAGSEIDTIRFLQHKATEPHNRDFPALTGALLSESELILRMGGPVTKAIELSYQAGYINKQYDIANMAASQLRLHGSIYARLGHAPLAELHCGIVQHIHGQTATSNDTLSAACQLAYMRALSGRYEDALKMLERADPRGQKTLRLEQMWRGFRTMVRLKRALHRNELFAAEHLLRELRPIRKLAEPGVVFETHVLEIDFFIRSGDMSAAFDYVGDLIAQTKSRSGSDIAHRIRLLTLKAQIWVKAEKSAKGFSIALRAASAAQRAMILPAMWNAIGTLCTILTDLEEYDGARKLLEAIMPQALGGDNEYYIATLYSTLTDAYMGLAGKASPDPSASTKERDLHINAASLYLERAKESYARIEDLNGTLDVLAKKAAIFRYQGEVALAEETEDQHECTLQGARRAELKVLGVEG